MKSLFDPMTSAMLQPLLFPTNTYLDPRQSVLIESDELAAKPHVPQSHPIAKVAGESVRITRNHLAQWSWAMSSIQDGTSKSR